MPPQLRPGPLWGAYARRQGDLLRLFYARLGDTSLAEDLIQELYLRLGRVRDVESVVDPDAYIFRLAYNLASDHLRSRRRRVRLENDWTRDTQAFNGGELAAAEPSPDDALSSRQELKSLLEALARLPPRSRRIFVLHKLDGRSYKQVATELRISVSTVEKHMSRALAHLSRLLDR